MVAKTSGSGAAASALKRRFTVQNATIRIDGDRAIGKIDQKVYGNFLEMMERAVYGGAFEPGSPLADDAWVRAWPTPPPGWSTRCFRGAPYAPPTG